MSTETKQYTREEISAAFTASVKKIKTGKLKDDITSRTFVERCVVQFILTRQLEPTEASFDLAFSELAPSLPWAVKPARLLLKEGEAVEHPQVSSDRLAKNIAAAAAADKYTKEQEEFTKASYQLVEAFMPIKRGRIDYRRKDEVQTRLNQHIAREKARGCKMKDVHSVIAVAVRKEYDAVEGEQRS